MGEKRNPIFFVDVITRTLIHAIALSTYTSRCGFEIGYVLVRRNLRFIFYACGADCGFRFDISAILSYTRLDASKPRLFCVSRVHIWLRRRHPRSSVVPPTQEESK
jgi:hypothetical protein